MKPRPLATPGRTSLYPAVAFAALLSVIGLLALGCSPGEGGAPGEGAEPAREEAPEFSLPSLEGDPVTLSELRGKTVIIDFWATWCPPCEFQVPELNAFWADHSADGDIAVFGISVDEGGPEIVRSWVEEKGVGYPILLGDDGLARRYGAMGFPTLIIIAPDGTIDSRHIGLIERASLEEAVERQRAEFVGDPAGEPTDGGAAGGNTGKTARRAAAAKPPHS